MLVLMRWVVCIVAASVAMIMDIKYKKISNGFNYFLFAVGLIFLVLDFSTEYVLAFMVALLVNIFLVGKLYMGGDAKLMVNIALLVGYASIYIFLCFLIMMAILYTLKIIVNFKRQGILNTGTVTICGPFFFIATTLIFIILY